MKRVHVMVAVGWVLGLALGVLGSHMLSAQDPMKAGKELQRAELTSAKGMEGILVLRELPPGGESGQHTQSGNEMGLIRFRGHFPKGGYDVHDGRAKKETSATQLQ